MRIANLDFGEYPVFLAPMEDVTDPAFRLMCKRFGADMVYTEFVSSDALVRSVNSTMRKLNISDEERPVAIQIYGKNTDADCGLDGGFTFMVHDRVQLDLYAGFDVRHPAANSYVGLGVAWLIN